ncbi:class I SAM-dependent methyltransferase [Streptomyces sp. NBC_01381]|uniref:class I SAM-dependent methyltransferase n=1 Tax=Streptomyces sp. NBC_01381 TaxID=2903845 RepID=UPI00225905B1|nr:class I SAM-dependent methyltransferase [Streptomyces sp. NBC_01381]MCX4673216.1 class I SAM-dependent methyltransferase [Streptomyces sp. NBC_01381]
MAHPASQPHSHTPAPHGTGPHPHAPGEDGAGPQSQHSLAEILDLDAALFASYLTAVTGRVACLAGSDVTHIVDLGAGTGTGTFALLDQFPTARVTAVDSSAEMLAGLTEAARARGLGDRVHTLRADAGAGLPGVTDADLVWASASLHHLDDPAAALAGIRTALRPGGLLAVAELDGMPRFLPADAVPDRPGLEARCREALDALHAEQVPHLGADWGVLLAAAGLTVERERTEQLELRAPLPEGAGRYAYLALGGIRGALDGRIDPADLAAFDALLDGGPQDVRHRDDLVVRSTRQLWVARRPGQ